MRRSAARAAGAFAGLCLVGAVLSFWFKVNQHVAPESASLALTSIPTQFAGWAAVRSDDEMVSPYLEDEHGRPIAVYDRIVARTYARPGYAPIMLMVAYKRRLEEDRIHKPETCYFSQGFVLTRQSGQMLRAGGREIPAESYLANRLDRRELVLYFIRSAGSITRSSLDQRLAIFRAWLSSSDADGVLVRVSSVESPATSDQDVPGQRAVLEAFLRDLISASPAKARAELIG